MSRMQRRAWLARTAGGGVALGAAPALAACGTAGEGQGAAAPGAGGPPASITFLGRESGSEVAVYKGAIEQYNAAQSRVRVAHELATGNFDQKLQTLVVGGTPPDANYMHSQTVPTYVAQGVPAALDAYNRKDKALDGLLPTALEAYRFKGGVYGVPDVATSYVMYVNRGLFEQMGLPVPTEKWTWTDYTAAAQKIVNGNAARSEPLFATANYTADDSWPTVLWQNGADILNKDRNAVVIDRPEAAEALTWIADQITRTRFHPAAADLGGKTAEQFFLDGKAAMLPTYSSRMGNIARAAQFQVETVHLPQGKQRSTRTACGGSAMTRMGKSPDATWQFLRYLAGEDFQWQMARVGGIVFPAHKKVAESPELFAGGQFTRSPKVTVDAMAYARVEPYIPRYLDLKAAIVKELSTIWNGEASVRDALTRARAVAEPILADGLSQIK
jgi:multiple sugar transport system substrate-binding protein